MRLGFRFSGGDGRSPGAGSVRPPDTPDHIRAQRDMITDTYKYLCRDAWIQAPGGGLHCGRSVPGLPKITFGKLFFLVHFWDHFWHHFGLKIAQKSITKFGVFWMTSLNPFSLQNCIKIIFKMMPKTIDNSIQISTTFRMHFFMDIGRILQVATLNPTRSHRRFLAMRRSRPILIFACF